MTNNDYIEAHTLVFGDIGRHAATESLRALRLLWPERMGDLVPVRLHPVAPYGAMRGLSGSHAATRAVAGDMLTDAIELDFVPSYWAHTDTPAGAERLLADVSNVIVHEYIHRIHHPAPHASRNWAEACQRIFDAAHIRVKVGDYRNLTLTNGTRQRGCPAGTLDYEFLTRFPAPVIEGILDRIEGGADWMDLADLHPQAISNLQVTTATRGRPRLARTHPPTVGLTVT